MFGSIHRTAQFFYMLAPLCTRQVSLQVDIPASYEMNMPPTNSTNTTEPLLVTFHLDINSFENMVMADMELGVMMRINLQWKDSRSKLIYSNSIYSNHHTSFISEDEQPSLKGHNLTCSLNSGCSSTTSGRTSSRTTSPPKSKNVSGFQS